MSIQKTPERNTILFVWFNQYAGIILKTPSKTLAIDPVEIKPKSLKNVDAILITHEHYDHLDPRLLTEIQKETKRPGIFLPMLSIYQASTKSHRTSRIV